MKQIKVVISGPALLMHNGQLANPRDPYAKALKEMTAKRKKSDEDHEEIARREFQGGLYHADDIGPYLPNEAIRAMIVEGSRKSNKGREFVSVDVEEERVPLQYKGPRDRDKLWADSNFILTAGVKVGTARVMRTRPIFRNWTIEFTVTIEDDASINVADVEQAITIAGRKVGLCDGRPGSPKGGRYGRFSIVSFEEISTKGRRAKAA